MRISLMVKTKRMDKLEYIPGDLVIYASLIKEPIAEICEVHEASYTVKFMHGNFAATSKEIKPITLTPEILEKNGWRSINGKYALKIKNANYVVLEFTKDGIYTYINENTMLFTIKYIHELQHFLFGLNINHEMEV